MSNPNKSQIGAYLKATVGTVPAAPAAGTRNGAAIDRLHYGSCVLQASAGATTGTPTSFTLDAKLQDSADGTTGWADFVPHNGTAAVAPIAVASTQATKNIDLAGAKRFVRVVETLAFVAGTAPTLGAACSVILGGAKDKPAV